MAGVKVGSDALSKVAQELAERLQGGDSLAMDFASRMQRAKEQGFESMYHETSYQNQVGLLKGDDGFDLSKIGAARVDELMPRGVFLKGDDGAIGVVNKDDAVQMNLMARKGNQAEFKDRSALEQHLLEKSPEWRKMKISFDEKDRDFNNNFKELSSELQEMGGSFGSPEYDAQREKIQKMMGDWKAFNEKESQNMQQVSSEYFKDRGYSSINVLRDEGSGGREINTTIMLNPEDIRSTKAAFDPAKKDSSNLLASIGAGTLATGGLLASDDSEASFIGAAAKTWNKGAEALAKKMTDEGASRDEIWQATGQMGSPTFKDVDGRWKQEISDQGFKEKPLYSDTDENYTTSNDPDRWFSWRDEAAERGGLGIQKGYDLGDLVEAYPQLRGTKVLPNEENAFRGSYDNDRTITVASPDALMSLDEANYKRFEDEQLGRSIPLHELQHAIQEREGFAKGGSPEMFDVSNDLYRKSMGDWRNIRVLKKFQDGIKRSQGVSDEEALSQAVDRFELIKKRRPSDLELEAAKNITIEKIDESMANLESRGFRQYQRLAGEAEARNVQTRLDYDMGKRVSNPPWSTLDVPEDELIVRGNKLAEMGAGIAATSTLPWMAKRAEAAEQERISAQIDESIANMSSGQAIEAPSNPYYQTAADAVGKYNRALKGSPAEYLLGAEDLENYFRKGAYGEANLGDAGWAALNIGEAAALPLEGLGYLGRVGDGVISKLLKSQ